MPAEDIAVIQALRVAGVLADASKIIKVDLTRGAVCFGCGDGHEIVDIVTHEAEMLRRAGCADPVPHQINVNGGALVLDRQSPLYCGDAVFDYLVRQIIGALRLKGARAVKLYIHRLCGMTNGLGPDDGCGHHRPMPLMECIASQMRARRDLALILRREMTGVGIACKLHVDFSRCGVGDDFRKRTYKVSWDAWMRYTGQVPVVGEESLVSSGVFRLAELQSSCGSSVPSEAVVS